MPLLPGMLIRVEQEAGHWSQRVRSRLGEVVDTIPPMLSRSVVDLADPSTQEMARLWLALSLGHPEHYVPSTLELDYSMTTGTISSRLTWTGTRCPGTSLRMRGRGGPLPELLPMRRRDAS